MRLPWINRRLKRMEAAAGTTDVLLRFRDGSTRSIKIRSRPKNHRLQLLLASMNLYYHNPPMPRERPEKPRVITKFEPILKLLGESVEIETSDRTLVLARNMCWCAAENERERQQKSGNVDPKSAGLNSSKGRNGAI